jgi:DNA-binding transcriptional LysR family regulator
VIIRRKDNPPSFRELEREAGHSRSHFSNCFIELRRRYNLHVVDDRNQLTEVGEGLYRWARRLLRQWERGEYFAVRNRQQLLVGASGRVMTFILPRVVRSFLAAWKTAPENTRRGTGMDVVFHEGGAEEVLDDLRAGLTDVAVCGVPARPEEGDLEHQVLWDNIPMAVIAARNHPTWGQDAWAKRKQVKIGELAGETLCILEEDWRDRLHALRTTPAGADRVLVQRYASVIAQTQTGSCLGLMPMLGAADRSLAGEQNLVAYDIKDAPEIEPRKVALWLRKDETGEGRPGEKDDDTEFRPGEVDCFLRVLREELGGRAGSRAKR